MSLCVLLRFVLSYWLLIQLVNGDQLSAQVNSTKVRTLTISGTRGKILDTNGIPLAVDQKNYKLEFYREYNTIEQRKTYTDAIIKAIDILDANSVNIETKFAIKYEIVNNEKQYVFNWGNVSQESAKTLEDRWRQDFYFSIKEDEKKDCNEMYEILRTRYHIPEDMSDDQAFKVLSVWQNSIQNYYYSRSITVAKNLDEDIVAKLESFSHMLAGFSISETTSRFIKALRLVLFLPEVASSLRAFAVTPRLRTTSRFTQAPPFSAAKP